MFQPNLAIEKAYRFSRLDVDHLLSTASPHPIFLEDLNWETAEHYYQIKIVESESVKKTISEARSARQAYRIGNRWYRRKIKGWRTLRRVLMTRALYTKVQMYPDVRNALLAIEEDKIVETSLYDHYWGIGRDQRGENMLGQIWMDIRDRVRNAAENPGVNIGQE